MVESDLRVSPLTHQNHQPTEPPPADPQPIHRQVKDNTCLWFQAKDWPCYLLQPVAWSRSDGVPAPSLSLKRPCALQLALSCLLRVNKPGLASWRMRDHIGQSQVSPLVTAEALNK